MNWEILSKGYSKDLPFIIHPSTHPSIHSSIHPSIHPPIHLSTTHSSVFSSFVVLFGGSGHNPISYPTLKLLFPLLDKNSYSQCCHHICYKICMVALEELRNTRGKGSTTPHFPIPWCQYSSSRTTWRRMTVWVSGTSWQFSESCPRGSREQQRGIGNPEKQLPVGARNHFKTNPSLPKYGGR